MSLSGLEEGLQLPLSPHDEGYLRGLASISADDYLMHFDGVDHLAYDVLSEDIHPDLAERSDFLEGMGKGVALRRSLNSMGYSISREESMEKLLAYSHGGSE